MNYMDAVSVAKLVLCGNIAGGHFNDWVQLKGALSCLLAACGEDVATIPGANVTEAEAVIARAMTMDNLVDYVRFWRHANPEDAADVAIPLQWGLSLSNGQLGTDVYFHDAGMETEAETEPVT